MEIPREEAERFCVDVKRKFNIGFSAGKPYDKADMLEDLAEFLKKHGVEVSG